MEHPRLVAYLLLLQVLLATIATAVSAPSFPERFSANVSSVSSWGKSGCDGLPVVTGKVYQDKNSSLLTHNWVTPDSGKNFYLLNTLLTIPASTADPDTPEATNLTLFTWDSDTESRNCEYQIHNGKIQNFFGFPLTVLVKREAVGNVVCEKWSNTKTRDPHSHDWAVWFPINAQPPYSIVAKAEYYSPYHPPHGNPIPSCTLDYTFTNFSTAPIPPQVFAPPKQWLKKCNDSDGGITTKNIPNNGAYVCVSPGKNRNFSIALRTKPQHDVTIEITPCSPDDGWYCVNGAHCKDCVKFSRTTLTFGPRNWSMPQTVEVMYLAPNGDSQFKISSPNYYITNPWYEVVFSTCACENGKICYNNCQDHCG